MAGVMLAIMLYGCISPKLTHPRGENLKQYIIEDSTKNKRILIRIKGNKIIDTIHTKIEYDKKEIISIN